MTEQNQQRPRRLRKTRQIRRVFQNVDIGPQDFIYPIFVHANKGKKEIKSMPEVFQHDIDSALSEAEELVALEIPAVIVFGIASQKDDYGSEAYSLNASSNILIKKLKERFKDELVVISDLCLDEYTTHGHCGILRQDATIDNDETLRLYGKIAEVQAACGADFVAPSGMMDNQVGVIRNALDASGFKDTGIISYAVKFASALYAPFRDAVNVELKGDRRSYQQSSLRGYEDSMLEAKLDIDQGADALLVKPAGPNTDIVYKISEAFSAPIGAYQVSGEYAMIKQAHLNGFIDELNVLKEYFLGVKRAGASFILSYYAKHFVKNLKSLYE
jgi:porphobilinogen synthase